MIYYSRWNYCAVQTERKKFSILGQSRSARAYAATVYLFFPLSYFFAIEGHSSSPQNYTVLVRAEGVRKVFAGSFLTHFVAFLLYFFFLIPRSVMSCNSCGPNDEEGEKQNDRH